MWCCKTVAPRLPGPLPACAAVTIARPSSLRHHSQSDEAIFCGLRFVLSPLGHIVQAFAIFSTLPYAVGQVQDVGLIFLR